MFGKLYFIFLKKIRFSKVITFLIWGIKIEKYHHKTFWDLTTLVLKKELLNLSGKKKYLDMGCGQFAILGQFFKKKNKTSKVTAVDIYDEFVENSINCANLNNNYIQIKKSNLFSNINEKFDLISFNPPYVSSDKKNDNLEFPNIRYSDLDGIKTTTDFLKEAKKYLTINGKILLGLNTFYVPIETSVKVIKNSNFYIEKVTKMKFNTSVVYRIRSI
tara:strand:+ start:27303 stop:27953 length:651 start_codon:yes stop_codon:yes gene_type:complete